MNDDMFCDCYDNDDRVDYDPFEPAVENEDYRPWLKPEPTNRQFTACGKPYQNHQWSGSREDVTSLIGEKSG